MLISDAWTQAAVADGDQTWEKQPLLLQVAKVGVIGGRKYMVLK